MFLKNIRIGDIKCYIMIEFKFLMLIKQALQKSVLFATIGIF